jgi:uncharacterized protein YndB with AHSA1/START domain
MKSSHTRGRLRSIRVFRRFGASAQRVFDAWLDPDVARRWLFATALHPIERVKIDARPKGSFRFVERRNREAVQYTGSYLKVVPPRHLAFTLSMKDIPRAVTRVSVEFVPLETGCKLVLTHEKLPPNHADRTEARWTGILYGLAETLASNDRRPETNPPRVTRRQDEIPVPDLR